MTYTPDDELVSALTDSLISEDQAVRTLIVAELKSMLPEFEDREAEAAERYHAAYLAIQPAEHEIAELDTRITDASAELASWQEQADRGDMGAKIAARPWISEWTQEIENLTGKRQEMTEGIQPLRQEQDRARTALDHATLHREALEANADPLLAYWVYGRDTGAYRAFRFGAHLDTVLRNREHPEYEAARRHLDHLVSLTGKEQDWTELKADIYAQANPPEPALTGAQEVARTHAHYESIALSKIGDRTVQRVEDLRGPAAPKIPRNETVRDYMRTDRLSDMLPRR